MEIAMSMVEAITKTVVTMTIEQLLVAAQLEGIASIGWNNHTHLQAHVTIRTLRFGQKTFPFMMDEARQIIEFPDEARNLLVSFLVNELTEHRGN
jgi:hypothetical protein